MNLALDLHLVRHAVITLKQCIDIIDFVFLIPARMIQLVASRPQDLSKAGHLTLIWIDSIELFA